MRGNQIEAGLGVLAREAGEGRLLGKWRQWPNSSLAQAGGSVTFYESDMLLPCQRSIHSVVGLSKQRKDLTSRIGLSQAVDVHPTSVERAKLEKRGGDECSPSVSH